MILSCFSSQCVENVEGIEWSMKETYYRDILEINLHQREHLLGLKPSWVFQQNYDTKHTASLTKPWLSLNRCSKMAKSELNLIEDL